MTGLNVIEIIVHVEGVVIPKEPKVESEPRVIVYPSARQG